MGHFSESRVEIGYIMTSVEPKLTQGIIDTADVARLVPPTQYDSEVLKFIRSVKSKCTVIINREEDRVAFIGKSVDDSGKEYALNVMPSDGGIYVELLG